MPGRCEESGANAGDLGSGGGRRRALAARLADESLTRDIAGRRRRTSTATLTKRVEMVELIASPSPRATTRYTVRVGKVGIEVADDFDAATLRRLVAVLSAAEPTAHGARVRGGGAR